jgi:hypothetical protein
MPEEKGLSLVAQKQQMTQFCMPPLGRPLARLAADKLMGPVPVAYAVEAARMTADKKLTASLS